MTTRTASLPRPSDLTDMLIREDRGDAVEGLALRVADGVAEVVRKQVQAGIAGVTDGEVSKLSFATYVKERLAGFGGTGGFAALPPDLEDFPDFKERVLSGISMQRTLWRAPSRPTPARLS